LNTLLYRKIKNVIFYYISLKKFVKIRSFKVCVKNLRGGVEEKFNNNKMLFFCKQNASPTNQGKKEALENGWGEKMDD